MNRSEALKLLNTIEAEEFILHSLKEPNCCDKANIVMSRLIDKFEKVCDYVIDTGEQVCFVHRLAKIFISILSFLKDNKIDTFCITFNMAQKDLELEKFHMSLMVLATHLYDMFSVFHYDKTITVENIRVKRTIENIENFKKVYWACKEYIDTPSCNNLNNKPNGIPKELDTEEARLLFKKLVDAGYMSKTDEGYKWKEGTRKKSIAYFADKASDYLKLNNAVQGERMKTSWKPFEELFGISGLSGCKNEWLNKSGSLPKDYKIIDALFEQLSTKDKTDSQD